MKQYLLPLTLGLALAGNARAEEPKECIDKIVLEVQIDNIPNDPFSEAYFSANTKREKKVLERLLLKPVQQFYADEVQLPIDIYVEKKVPKNKKGLKIRVKYTLRNSLIEEDYSSLPEWMRTQHSKEEVKDFLTNAFDFTVQKRREIFLFPFDDYYKDRKMTLTLPQYTSLLTYTINHGIGHVLGLDDRRPDEHGIDDCAKLGILGSDCGIWGADIKLNLMYGMADQSSIITKTPFGFSPDDKQKIQSQLCKPEQQQ